MRILCTITVICENLIIISALVHWTPTERFVNFRESPKKTSPVSYVFAYSRSKLEWYAGEPHRSRFILLGYQKVSITFDCRVQPLNDESALEFMRICFQKHWRIAPICDTMKPNHRRSRLVIGDKRNVDVDLHFSPETGSIATVRNISPSQSIHNLTFQCIATNRHGSRSSNPVEILDYRDRFPRDRTIFRQDMTFDNRQDYTFSCIDFTFPTSLGIQVFQWSVCSDTSCEDIGKQLDDESKSRIQLWPDGRLYWSYLDDSTKKKLQGKWLKCSCKDEIVALFGKKIAFKDSNANSNLRLEKPSKTETLEIFDSEKNYFTFPVSIKGDGQDIVLKWNGKACQNASRENGLIITNGFLDKDDGTTCSVNVRKQDQGSSTSARKKRAAKHSTKTGSYTLRILGYPKIHPTMKKEIFTVNGSDAEVECVFEKESQVTSLLMINGLTVNFDSQTSISGSVRKVNRYLKNVMLPLDISINRVRPKKGERVTYRARNMVYKNATLSSTHYVECLGYRGYYETIHRVILSVAPRPVTKMVTNSTINAREYPVFKCAVDNKAEIEGLGVLVNLTWRVENKSINAFDPESFELMEDGTTLKVNRKKYSASIKDEDREKEISCVVQLVHRNKDSGEDTIFFKTKVSSTLYLTPNSTTCYLWYILIVVIALLILAFALALVRFKLWRLHKGRKYARPEDIVVVEMKDEVEESLTAKVS